MLRENPFVLKKEDYQRDINVLKHYVDDAVFYLSTMTGKSKEECRTYIIKSLKPGGRFQFKDPQVVFFERGDNGDRVESYCTLSGYISDSVKRKQLIAPTFTTYINPKEKQSLLVMFIDENIKARSRAKKAMFKAKVAGDKQLEILKKIEQGNKKISNNSISGAHVSSSTPLVNKSAHSTLTSNCRTTSGFGNANNEKMLSGNRHYWNPNIVINNIVSIINHTDYNKLNAVLVKYNLRHPTVEETMKCIQFSTNLYWRNKYAMNRILSLVNNLTDIQRSAFVFTGDLFQLKEINNDFVRQLITDFTSRVRVVHPNPGEIIKNCREEYHGLVSQFFPEDMKGRSLDEKHEKFIGLTKPDVYGYIASTIENVHNTIIKYSDLIDALFVTVNVPASLAYFPLSIRRSALTSDTDSTIFTVQDWVHWYQGGPGFNETSSAVSASMIFLSAETITHILARMSANFGIETERIHQVAMKNEYKFPVFVPTQVGKHYFAAISCQEGNLNEELDMEIKGVHLKSSNVPKEIMKKAEGMMRKIVDIVMAGNKIRLTDFLKEVGDIEREIKRSVLAGESTYFRKAQIKTPASYKKSAEESPYQNHTFWQEVFAPKYGSISEPPYMCLKASVNLSSRTLLSKWIESISDKELALRLKNWLHKTQKNGMQSILISEEALRTAGMPVEIAQVMDMRKTIFDISSVFYIILETLGYYCVNQSITRLVSDDY